VKAFRLTVAGASVALLCAIAIAAPHAVAQSQTTLTIATVNNPQMVDMQHAVGDFENKRGSRCASKRSPRTRCVRRSRPTATGGGQFDVATVGTYEVPIWAKNKWIVGLDPYFGKLDSKAKSDYDLADIIPNIRKGLSYDGALFALPFYGESSMTFYNKKSFADAHLTMPAHPTWDQIAGFAKKLHAPSKINTASAYAVCRAGEMGAPLSTVINTFGGSWFDEKWQPQLTGEPTKSAIAFTWTS
jgi:sorbitol/mannitol transport system substrate-binding protein